MTTKEKLRESVSHWENEVEYFEDALEGIKKGYAVLQSLRDHAEEKYQEAVQKAEEEGLEV